MSERTHALAHDGSRRHHLVDTLLSRLNRHRVGRQTTRKGPPQRKKILFESLEPRLLLSADLQPGSGQFAGPIAPPADIVHLQTSNTPRINWSQQATSGNAPLYSSSFVDSFDLDNFSSPLVPVSPAGSTVHAGGVQGMLDFDGDEDTLTIDLDAGQSFTVRLKPDPGLQAELEAIDPANNSLGMVQAGHAGDTLILQSRPATDAGSYSIRVASLAGLGAYTVELFLNAALEEEGGDDAASAQDLDSTFSYLLDSSALHGAVIGALAGQLPPRTLAQEDFQDETAFWEQVNGGIWSLETISSGDAYITLEEYFGVGEYYGEAINPNEVVLTLHADQNYDYDYQEIDDGEGGTLYQESYTYDESLSQATWIVDLTGATQAILYFEQWGYDPQDDVSFGNVFFGTANFDGVALSVDGENWIVLENFGPDFYGSRNPYQIDLVAAAAQHGITLGADTRVRFQCYDPGGTFDYYEAPRYRHLDNIRITTDQQQLLLVPSGVSASVADYNNDLSLLTDGVIPQEQSDFHSARSLWWFGQEVSEVIASASTGDLMPSANLTGLYFDVDLGSVHSVSDIVLSVDNNDDYALDYSVDGVNWSRLLTVFEVYGNDDVGYGMDTFSTNVGSADYDANLDFDPVMARYLRIYATGGDGAYAIGELQAFTTAAQDQEDWYRLSLDAGELASFTLSLDGGQLLGNLALELYDQNENLLTAGMPVDGQVQQSIEGFRTPAAGTYYLRVTGNAHGQYNLVAVRQALFGAASTGTKDLTGTPIVLDRLSQAPSTIRVAVLGGGNIIDQLNDDSYFDFTATYVGYQDIDTLAELNQFDVVAMGEYIDPALMHSLAPTLRTWVESGHGLVMTGWALYYNSLQYGAVSPDLDAIVPIQLATYAGYNYGSLTVSIDDDSHPVTQGINDFSNPYYYDYVVYGVDGIDPGAQILGSVSGWPAIVVGTPQNGRSVALAPDYIYGSGWYSGPADRLLEQAVAWSALPINTYTVSARAGTDLAITLDLIGGGPDQPDNNFGPLIELFDGADNLLASGTTTLVFAVLGDMQFTIKVRGTGSGDYLLRASGDLVAEEQVLEVVASSLDGLDRTSSFPGYVDFTFSAPLLYTTVESADLQINGVGADSVQVLSPTMARFWFGNAFVGDGDYDLSLDAGGITDIHGNTNTSWARAFTLDTQGPQVVSVSLTQGETLAPGAHQIALTFNEDLDTTYLDQYDVQLYEAHYNKYVLLEDFDFDIGTRTLTLTTPPLGEGSYVLTLLPGFYGFKDLLGNPLDGNADGNGGDSYDLVFQVDIDTAAYPEMQALAPLGSMVYDPVIAGAMLGTGDVDAYTISLDAGQLLTVVLDMLPPDLQIRMTVVDADDDNIVATAEGASGEGVVLQTLAGLSGDYRIELTSLAGAGRYDFMLVLNALLETEMLNGGATNDSVATASALEASSLLVGAAGASRMAIVGERGGAAAPDDDYYSVQLTAGQANTVAIAWADSNAGALRVDLLAPDGSVLAHGAANSRNAQQSIQDFIAPSDGNYLLKVSGEGAGRYNLVVTRGIAITLPSSLPGVLAQDIGLTGQVMGNSSIGAVSERAAYLYSANANSPWSNTTNNAAMDAAFGAGAWDLLRFETVNVVNLLADHDTLFLDGSDRNADELEAFLNVNLSLLEAWVAQGNSLFINAAPNEGNGMNLGFGGVVLRYSDSSNSGSIVDTAHPIFQGPSTPVIATYFGSSFTHASVSGGGITHLVNDNTGDAVLAELRWGRGTVLFGGMTTTNFHSPQPQASNLRSNILAYAASQVQAGGAYSFQAAAGQTLDITLTLPGQGAGEPGNSLVPIVELLDAGGNILTLVAVGSGHWTHDVAADATYRVKVGSTSGTGDYVLRVTGIDNGANAVPQVIASSPAEGARLLAAPTTLTFDLSENILVTSLDVDDLEISGGGAVVGVEMLDGDSVRFILAMPAADGSYSYTLKADGLLDLQGAGNAAYSGSFTVDTTPPRVVSQTPEVQSIAPFSNWTLTFSEALDPASVQTSDFTLRNPSNGTIFISSATVSEDRLSVTLGFSGQYSAGNYTLTVGTTITDLAGNRLDQDSVAAGLQGHVGTMQVASPDLAPQSISVTQLDGSPLPAGGVALGSTVKVTWTVNNIGTDAARSSFWYDSLWLSTDTNPSGDILLHNVTIDVDPSNLVGLPAGGSYTMSANVTLPLNDNMNAGEYYIRVQVDNYGYFSNNIQPESNENNNALYSSALPAVIPPLPDLTVSEVSAPAVIEAGKNVTIAWTVENVGAAVADGASGYWHDRIVLSSDEIFGNGDDLYLSEIYSYDDIAAGGSQTRSTTVNVSAAHIGSRYVLVKTDYYNAVYERGNEGNNVGSAAVQVIVPSEDLTPTELNAPDAALFGALIDVSWTVQNVGAGPTYGEWYDRLWLSTDATRGGDDIALHDVWSYQSPDASPLAAGAQYTRNIQNIRLPLNLSLTDGSYYLLLETNAGGQEPELDKTNNLLVRAIELQLDDYADLTVSDIQLPAGTVPSGAPFTVGFTLNNQGEAAANNFRNYLYLSSDGTSLNHYVGDYHVNQSLDAGASIEVNTSITVPLYAPGNWYLVILTDVHNQIYEHAGENNNRSTSAAPIQSVLPPLPDLIVSNIDAPLQALAGEAITFSWTITNQGTGDFAGTWYDRVYLTEPDGGPVLQDFGYFSFSGTLAVGASVTLTQDIVLSPIQDGARRMVVVTDALNSVNETPAGQNNNHATDADVLAITFPPLPNLQVSALVPPSDPASGTQTVISWTVANTGVGATSAPGWFDQIRLSLDTVWGNDDDIVLGTVINPNFLPAGESYQNSSTIAFPKGLSGEFHFLVKTDVHNQVFEDDNEGDNVLVSARIFIALTPPPDLRVDTVEAPNDAFSGQPITVSWTVGNHGPGRTVEPGWYDRIVMSEDDVLGNADDRHMSDVWHTGALDPDESYSTSKAITLPIGVIGTFYFFVVTDVANHVYEHGSDTNNSRADMLPDLTGPEPTVVSLTPPPDLEVYSVGTLANPQAGQRYTATWRVVNFGATPTPNNHWTDRVYLSSDSTLDASDIHLGDRLHYGALPVYEEDANGNPLTGYYDTSLNITLPFDISGSYRLVVKTDIHNQVFEGFDNPDGPDGEDNNTWASSAMQVVSLPADLVVDTISSPASGEAGKQVSVSWTVRNAGSGESIATSWVDQIRLSVDDILFDDDDVVLQNFTRSGPLGAGQSYSRTESITLPFSVSAGSYRIYALTDVGGHVHESDNGNNSAFASIAIARATPDLQVLSLTHAAEGMVALDLAVSWQVQNLGANQTNVSNWYDDVFLSLDQVLDASDVAIGQAYRNAGLAVGESYSVARSFTLPIDLTPNDYYVIVRTDKYNQVTEGTDEANNLRVSASKVHIAAFDANNPQGVQPLALLRPDLTATNVVAPQETVSGQNMQVSWTVTNNGLDPTGNRSWYDAVYLSRDGVLDRNTDIYLGYAYASNLAAGESYHRTLQVQVPYGQSGPFRVFVVTDAGQSITEPNEFNNAAMTPAFTQVRLAPPADLVVGTITIPANGIPGQTATITYSVSNQGTNPALGGWNDAIYLSADDSWDIDDPLFGVAYHYGELASGSSYSATLTAPLPGLTPGDYRVIVRSDIRNHIPEGNENNNIGASLDAMTLDVEELVLDLADTGNLSNGQSVYYKFEVGAGETIRLRFDSAGADIANELYVRYGAMPTRGQFDFAAREGFEADPELLIPTTEAGTYYVLAYGQSVSGNPAFSILAEVIPFSIIDVDADEIGNAGDATLRIEGAKFSASTVFSLVAPDGSRIDARTVYLENTSEAYATFAMFGAAPGQYDVVATQADGSTTGLPDAVSVLQGSDAAVFMSIAGPTQIMVSRTAIFTLDYVNDGGADTMAPLMVLQSYSATPLGFSASDLHTTPIHIMAASFDGPMDILRPGARYSVPIVFQTSVNTGPLDIRVGRILADDTRLIEDWDAIEASVRPTGMANADWDVFWGRIKPLIGLTWGEYVQVLDRMMKLVSEPGHPVRDVREIFARMFVQNPDFVPYASMAGQVRDAEADAGLADIQMAAYLVRDDGALEFKSSAISDADGRYRFARLAPGDYKVVAIGRALDMDRDGQVDLGVPVFTLGHAAPGDAGVIYIQPLGGIGTNNDSNATLDRDSNGITHMVWSRDGSIWHAWFDAASGQWRDAQAISAGDSYGPAIASSDKLFDGATAGIIVAWQQGKGNDAEILFAVARATVGGGFEWSAPAQLTDDDTLDAGVQIIVGDNGLVMITHLKRDGEIQDDTDIYYDIFALSESDFLWPVAVAVPADAATGDTLLAPEGVSVAYGRQWKFGPWDFFGTSAELVLALSGSIGENNCVATLGAQGQISGSFKGSSIRSTITGNGNVSAEWKVNQASKDWLFSGAKAGWGAQAQFDWRYGLSTVLSKIPHPAATSAYLAYSLGVALAARVGLEFEDGITFGGGASFSNMEWKFTQPFPDFVWPESIGEASLSGLLGIYAQLDVGPTGDSARLQGDITVTVDIAPEVQLKSITGNITFSGNIGWFTFNEVFSIDFYSASDLSVLGAPLLAQQASGPHFDAAALFGTGNVYGTNSVLSNVSQDLLIDSAMTLANDEGTLFGAWTHMTDPTLAIGSEVMVAEFGGSTWAPPVALSGSMGLNSAATAMVDGLGQRMVVWTHASNGGLGLEPTIEDYEAALDGNDVVYALYDDNTGSWSAMGNVASTTGMDSGIAVTLDADGNLVLSWLAQGDDDLTHLMTAHWNGSVWSSASEIAFGASVMDPAMERLGDDLIVFWTEDANPDPDQSEKGLYYSIFDGAVWSAGAAFDPIAMATGLALSAGVTVSSIADTSLGTEALFPPFPVPEECLKCKPEEIKRIQESAPECRDGGGTEVTFDDKTCTEKTIVYKPCVVRPRDPNDIIGPEGFGDEHWVAASATQGYMIRFENAADASAPAQRVVITQQLDDDLDWRTLRIDDFGFGEQIIEVDGRNAFYQQRLDYTGDETRGYYLDVKAAVDVTTGIVTWTLTTIDPATGDVPQDASIGFLPVNDTVYDENHDVVVQGTGKGEGYVTYTVKAKRAVETGAVIDAQALIIFDTEEPIETPAIFNTLDAGDPSSQVIAFAIAQTDDTDLLVQWGGTDDADGSGIRDYTIYVAVDGGEFAVWKFNTELTQAIYVGATGHTYSFYSTARDNAGNEESAPGVADASISVTGGVGAITGTKFEDVDGDGARDDGEPGLAGVVIYLDSNDNGSIDAGETSTLSAADGSYSFTDLAPGTYQVRELLPAGWITTLPGNGAVSVIVAADQTVNGVDFGNFALAQIGGQKYNDINANGMRDDGEEGLHGWVIQLDRHADGSVDATVTTDEYGYYRFTDLGPGSYRISEVLQSGWLQTAPDGGSWTVTPSSGEDVGGQDFGNVLAASISGVKFEDIDGDGQRDADEPGLAGWTIFLDRNNNGMLDGGEPSTVTDAQGQYAFANLLPGSYRVAEVMQAGWMQTSPGASPGSLGATGLVFSGMDVVLSLPEDTMVEQGLTTLTLSANDLADTLVGLDALRGDPRFAGIDGSGVTTVVIDTGIDLNHGWFGPDADNNGIADRIVFSWDFADGDADASDRNGHGSHVASLIGGQHASYGGVAPGADLIALKVFSDNGLGYFSYLEQALQWVVANADLYDIGVINLSLGDGGNWDSAIGRYGLGDELAALAGMNILVSAAAGNNFFGFGSDMGVAYPAADPAVLAVGAVWSGSFGGPVNYANGAADYTTGADRLAAFGQRDDELLDVLAPGTRMVGANFNGGTRTMFGTSQASAYMAGVATLAQDLALDHLGRRLNMAEFTSLLHSTSVRVIDGDDESDNVTNTGLQFARVDMFALAEGILALERGTGAGGGGEVTGDGALHPLAAPGAHRIDLSAGQTRADADFGNFLLGSVGGTVFHDLDANQEQDGDDIVLEGWSLFLDGNGNGMPDFGEYSTTTDALGQYRFDAIGPGSFRVMLVGQDGWTPTTDSFFDVFMTSGLAANHDFGVNARPWADPVADVTVDEGSKLSFVVVGNDTPGDILHYSLVGETHGATIDAASGEFDWTAPDGDNNKVFTVRVSDSAGGKVDVAFTVEVHNVAPTLMLSGPASVTDDQEFLLALSATDPGQDTVSHWLVHWGDDTSSTLEAASGTLGHRYLLPGSYTVTVTATDEDGDYDASTTVAVQAGTLKVTSLQGTNTGFQVRFNRAFDATTLNLYDSAFYSRGAADLALRDALGRSVEGSLVLDADYTGLRFVKTNGLLANGNYTLKMDSRGDAFVDSMGGLLDGNRDGVAGDNFSGTFTVNGSGAVLSIGEFSRGPGQAADVPAPLAGIPIMIGGAAGATQVAFTLAYDAALLHITGVSGGTGMPAGSSIGTDFSTPGQVRITLALGAALGTGNSELVRLMANVPVTAPYGAKQVLDLRDITLNTGATVRDDDGLHLVAYLGDASGNGKYSTLDVQRIQRTIVKLDNGLGAYPLVDPVVVADINGNGRVTALDAQRVLSEVMGIDRPEIPAIPSGMTLRFSGPDPVVKVADVTARPGESVLVPVSLDTAAGLESVEFTLAYPANDLELVAVRQGGLTLDFQYVVINSSVPGRLVVDLSRMEPMADGTGNLIELEFRVAAEAQGPLAIDLQATALNETWLTLNAESQPGLDPTDGVIQVDRPTPITIPPVEAPPVEAPPVEAPPVVTPPVEPSLTGKPNAEPRPAMTRRPEPIESVAPAITMALPDVDFAALRALAKPGDADSPAAVLPPLNAPTAPKLPVIRFDTLAGALRSTPHRQDDWVGKWLGNSRDGAADSRLNNWKISLSSLRTRATT